MGTFKTLWDNYPLESRVDLFNNVLGGGWPDLVDDTSYENTCTIRLSVALNRSGYNIPDDLGQQDGGFKDKNANNIAIRVPTGEELVRRFFGDWYWGMSRQPGSPIDLSRVPTETGILIYRVHAPDAAGHVDLWNKNGCRIDCHASFAVGSYSIALWKLP